MSQLTTLLYTGGFAVVGLLCLRFLALALLAPLAARRRPLPGALVAPVPVVTVQLPLYNEQAVAVRAIDALCRLRWPAGRLEIQILDDSTDGTTGLARDRVQFWRQRGVDITLLRRADRAGFKAGALAAGLAQARGQALALFDADFLPPVDFLERCLPYLTEGVAAVQARWGHLNAGDNWLTRAQALALDGHFLVEQPCQSRLGLFLNFNGTAGVWRREAIEAAGGWQGDTLTEDFDLSYRAQLAGWRIVVLPELVAPGELPADLAAYRRQQRRWAMGTAQVLRKLGGALLRAPIGLPRRLLAFLSLAGYVSHVILLILVLAAPLALRWPPRFPAWMALASLGPLGPPALYVAALQGLPGRRWRRLLDYPSLMLVTAGMALVGAGAVVAGLSGRSGTFERTPKSGSGGAKSGEDGGPADVDGAMQAAPEPNAGRAAWPEVGLALYAGATAVAAARVGMGWLAVFCGIFGVGFALVALGDLGQRRSPGRWVRRVWRLTTRAAPPDAPAHASAAPPPAGRP